MKVTSFHFMPYRDLPDDFPILGWPHLVETWMRTIKVLPAQ